MHFEHLRSEMFTPKLLTNANVKCNISWVFIILRHQPRRVRPCPHTISNTFSRKYCSGEKMRRNPLYVWTAGFSNCTVGFFKNYKKNNRPYSYRSSFLRNTPGWYNITWNGFTTKPYLQVICIWNILVARFPHRNCKQKRMSNAQSHEFS